jgi:hypothetical protein
MESIARYLFRVFERVADAHMGGIEDGDAGGEFVEACAADKIGDEGIDGNWTQRKRAEENDAGMRAGRMLAQVCELNIQRQKHALFIFSGSCDISIGVGKKILVGCSQDVMPQFSQYRF